MDKFTEDNHLCNPNFFIVGAPKAGTSSLYHYLDEHPEIFMCPEKEPNFFSYQEIKAQNLYYRKKNIGSLRKYLDLFKGVDNEKAIGEASVSYLFYQEVPKKIKKAVPDAKIIIILRNPIKRAFSHYLMDLRLGYTGLSFEDIIFNKEKHPLHYQQYLELGLYSIQVQRYLDTFEEKNLKIVMFEEFIKDQNNMMASLFKFLNVDSRYSPQFLIKYNPSVVPKNDYIRLFYARTTLRRIMKFVLPKSILSRAARFSFKSELPSLDKDSENFLRSFYIKDIQKLENILMRDLQFWLIS